MNGRSFAGVGFLGGVYVIVFTAGRVGRSVDRFLNLRGSGVGEISGLGIAGIGGTSSSLFLRDRWRWARFRNTRLRDGVRKGVKPGCSLVEVASGDVWKGYSVCSDCCCIAAGGGDALISERGVGRNGDIELPISAISVAVRGVGRKFSIDRPT